MTALSLLGLCLVLSTISMISNQNLPEEETSGQLSELDQARLLEALHLKSTLGDGVWPGWGSTMIPVIVWNRSHEFLANYKDESPAGWSAVMDDDLGGEIYFQRTANEPQNFAVRVGDVWSASMATKQTTDVFLIQTFRDMFPTPVKQIFPYRLFLQPSETQIGGLLHETFHVYQYQIAPERITRAESIHKLGDQYESVAEAFQSVWKKESALLADALKAKTQKEKLELARQFLATRDARRNDSQLSDDLLEYERWLEWEEGTAKYMELAILKAASTTSTYQPLPGMKDDPDFKGYQNFDSRWSQEMIQLRYQTSSGETQFYMTGLAQAFLLDELLPDWKDRYWNDDVFLEDLLRTAVGE